ncbi:RNA-directed DNA polymerase from mobile element jockey [Trichonephila clavipes]|uniref:RNA-directed DNA polymerase from mobile element jockey n=1 Tax=Trichonephila clavipes TaxID=2585209 RepID=A0A8X6SM81_TRICX|nr:RNA-directed DNA polymerase from mobile element jockey [Trichonephila clavipes]
MPGTLCGAPIAKTTIPTRANARPATIDFGISCGLDDILVETHSELSSDHNPVQFIIPTTNNNRLYAQNCTTFTNWNLFQEILHSTIPGNPNISNANEIDEKIAQFTYNIHSAINQSSKVKVIKHNITFIPRSLRTKIAEKNRLRKQWQATHANSYPDDIHKIIRKKKTSQIHYPPLLGYRGLVYDTLDKANLFAETLEETFTENPEPYDDDHIEDVERQVRRFFRTTSFQPLLSPHLERSETSTNHQLLRLTNRVINGFNSGDTTGGAFLDVEKAFDRVWHDGLLYKMIKLNFPSYIIHLVNSYLSDRTFQVKILATLSRIGTVSAGSPQGSILSPLLYNIYTHDFPTTPTVDVCLFADDAAIIAQACNPDMFDPARGRVRPRCVFRSTSWITMDMSASRTDVASSVEVSDLFSLETMSFDVMAATDLIDNCTTCAESEDLCGVLDEILFTLEDVDAEAQITPERLRLVNLVQWAALKCSRRSIRLQNAEFKSTSGKLSFLDVPPLQPHPLRSRSGH